MKKFFCFFLGIVAVVILLNAGYLWLVSNYTLGLILETVLGFALLLYALLFSHINRLLHNRFGRYVKWALFLIAVCFLFTASLITIAGKADTVTYKEDAMLVLGAGIHEDKPSRTLCKRLDAAIIYHKMNPNALIVVSGGQGAQETITEALAMERYLIAGGVHPDVILREERATSTYENFLFTKELLDERLDKPYKMAYITNSFHVYRAGRVAKSAGLMAARMHAQNDWITLLPDYLRECCAVPAYWLRGR